MAVMLGFEQINGVLSMRDTMDLLEEMSRHEAAGRTFIAQRTHVEFERGTMRSIFGADYEAGYMATKAYHMMQGKGARYLVTLYRWPDGELLALVDGRLITDLRTGGASGVAARRVPIEGPVTLGIIGSGNQARMQLQSLASVYRIDDVRVYSPTEANRVAFAREMSALTGIAVSPAKSVEEAVRGRMVVASASSSRSAEPVIRREWLDACRLLCAVGNTRPQFAEIDVPCFADASMVIVDSLLAIEEAGDLIAAEKAGALPESRLATLADVVTGKRKVPATGMITFKSVGTALQDIALAGRYYELLGGKTPGAVADLASMRPGR